VDNTPRDSPESIFLVNYSSFIISRYLGLASIDFLVSTPSRCILEAVTSVQKAVTGDCCSLTQKATCTRPDAGTHSSARAAIVDTVSFFTRICLINTGYRFYGKKRCSETCFTLLFLPSSFILCDTWPKKRRPKARCKPAFSCPHFILRSADAIMHYST
jgi:hypothetical protein